MYLDIVLAAAREITISGRLAQLLSHFDHILFDTHDIVIAYLGE